MRFVKARNYTDTGTKGRNIMLQVIHDMEAPELTTTAEAIANMWAGPKSPKSSAHYCYDNDSEVQCVLDKDVAWAAPGANHNGLHHELAGYAHQSPTDWRDLFSLATLTRCAINVAAGCEKYDIPIIWLTDGQLAAGWKGICDHAAVSRVFKKSTHWDCGPNFPSGLFIELVRSVPLLVQPDPTKVVLMNDCVAALRCPVDGGLQKLQADGGVFNDQCDHFHGSYPALGIDPGNKRVFKEIVERESPRTTTGYELIATSGERYDFPA